MMKIFMKKIIVTFSRSHFFRNFEEVISRIQPKFIKNKQANSLVADAISGAPKKISIYVLLSASFF